MRKKFRLPFATPNRRWWLIAGLLLPVLLLAACQGSPSFLKPASGQAGRVADLTWQMFGLAAIIFVVVESLLLFAVFRFRKRGEGHEPRQIFGHTRLEIAWTAAPGVVLIGVLYLTLQTMAYLLAAPPDSLQINVTGHQWWWEIEYPQQGIITANEIHVPVGRPVQVNVKSADVIHSFFAPELGGRVDVLPDRTNTTWFQADREGIFRGLCAEFCGLQHANMGFLVVGNQSFDAWVQQEKQPAAQPAASPA
ncbi:MAG: cytochrome c oxidase subunit II, partial [Chloroflexota bacterium]